MNVVIILPTYNEKGNIGKLISILEDEIFPTITNHVMYILVADDNSPDGTADEVRKLMKKWKNIDLNMGEKLGLGAAYVRAMTYAVEHMNANILFEMDADFFHDPKKIPIFIDKLEDGYDIAIGTRYSGGGSIPSNWGIDRKIYSIMGNLLVRSILMRFQLHDWTGGYRALKKEVFLKEKESLGKYKGYTFQVAFLHKSIQDGFKVAEVPFNATDRTYGRSKFAPAEYIFNLLVYVITARMKELARFIKFLIVGGTGFVVQLLLQEFSVFLGIWHPVSVGIGAESAILSNFLFNHSWTFKDTSNVKENASLFTKLLKFNVTSLAAIFIQVAAVWLGERLLGSSLRILSFWVPVRIIFLFPTIIFLIIPLNYLIYNKIIWKTQYLKHGKGSKL